MKTPVLIRPARLADADLIAGYNRALARETEGRDLDPARIGPGVRAVLDDASKGRYLVAELDGEVVGQLMVTFEWSDWRNGMFWWIQSVYVRPDRRGAGIFSALYQAVESEARLEAGVCGIRLYMEHHNDRARAAYLRLGMKPAGYEVLETDFTRLEPGA